MRRTLAALQGRIQFRSVATAMATAACAALSACDPCSGVLGCSPVGGNPYLAISGQIVDPVTGVGVDGVQVRVVRRAGVVVAEPGLSTVTANGGQWRAEFTPQSVGYLDADIAITTPAGLSYTATGVRLRTSLRGRDANVLDRWVDRLWFPNFGELYIRGSQNTRIAGAPVDFHRTGGVPLLGAGVMGDVVRTGTDFAGRVALFSIDDGDVYTSSLGPVIGNLIVRRSATDTIAFKDVSIYSSYVYRGSFSILSLGIGPSLAYDIFFLSRTTGLPVSGVAVSFTRTSGIALASSRYDAVSDTNGRFRFSLQALDTGAVQGRLIYRPPLAPAETLQIALPTFDADTARFLRVINVSTGAP